MKYWKNGIQYDAPDPTAEEIASMREIEMKAEAEYWSSIPYNDAVNTKIRERYTDSQEFAILRQKDEKPEEYAEYYAYCESCKTYVKEQIAKYVTTA